MSSYNDSSAALDAAFDQDKGQAFGAQLLGLFFAAVICGVNIHLFVNWSMYCASWETRLVRWYVRILFSCGLLYTGFVLAYSMELFVYGFGDYSRWTQREWIGWVIIFQGLFRPAVSVYFAEKAYKLLDRSKAFAVLIGLTILGSFGAMLGLRIVYMTDKENLISIFNFLRISIEAAGDMIITIALLFGIYRKKADFEHTQRLQRKLSMVILESQLPPTIFIIAFLVVCVTGNGELDGRARFFICGPSVYLLCLLGVVANKHNLDSFEDSQSEAFALRARQHRSAPVITVRTEQVVHTSPADATNMPIKASGGVQRFGGLSAVTAGSQSHLSTGGKADDFLSPASIDSKDVDSFKFDDDGDSEPGRPDKSASDVRLV